MEEAEAAGMHTLIGILRQTMGPRGRYAELRKSFGPPVRTRKASTIAGELDLEDAAQARGLARLRAATDEVNKRQGDGTSLAAVLADGLVSAARDISNLSEAVAAVAAGMRAEAQPVSRHLDRFLMAQACGVTIPSMRSVLGEVDPANVEWASSESPDTPEVSASRGWVGEATLLSPAFMGAADLDSRRAELTSPLLFRVAEDEPIADVLRALRRADEQGRAAVFFARKYNSEGVDLIVTPSPAVSAVGSAA